MTFCYLGISAACDADMETQSRALIKTWLQKPGLGLENRALSASNWRLLGPKTQAGRRGNPDSASLYSARNLYSASWG